MTNKLPEVGKRYKLHLKQFQKDQSIFIKMDAELLDFEEIPEETNSKEAKSEIREQNNSSYCKNYGKNETRYKVEKAKEEIKKELEWWKNIESRLDLFELKNNFRYIIRASQNLLNALDEQEKLCEFEDGKKQVETEKKVEEGKCAKCGKSFGEGEFAIKGSNNKFYCSYKCEEKKCPLCGIKFIPLGETTAKFCSPDCEVESEKPKSIWKNISELPSAIYVQLIVKFDKDDNGMCLIYDAYEEGIFKGSNLLIEEIKKESIQSWCTLTDFISYFEELQERVSKLEKS